MGKEGVGGEDAQAALRSLSNPCGSRENGPLFTVICRQVLLKDSLIKIITPSRLKFQTTEPLETQI